MEHNTLHIIVNGLFGQHISRIRQIVADGINVVGSKKVSFNNGSVRMAGNIYLPPDYDAAKKYPAIVVSHPWGSVKEQTSGLYAQQLARKGFITLAYDASHYGESGGVPRDLEDPSDRVQDMRSAVGYLARLQHRIGTVGVCAGGGYTLNVSKPLPVWWPMILAKQHVLVLKGFLSAPKIGTNFWSVWTSN